ncbi:DUF2452 domain-containing protein [Desulfofustis limnaeus]|uniref:DUF2452 domain-containing protein n=1 Tax=Desulfofustis limnaeus TaxID=2740163 RepID=UPI00338EE202
MPSVDGAPPIDLVATARLTAEADDALSIQAAGKLRLLAEQREALQEQARQILLQIEQSRELHRVPCAFRKIPGHAYHLYRRSDGGTFFSMIAAAEWNAAAGQSSFRFSGSYRLEADQTWGVSRRPRK